MGVLRDRIRDGLLRVLSPAPEVDTAEMEAEPATETELELEPELELSVTAPEENLGDCRAD